MAKPRIRYFLGMRFTSQRPGFYLSDDGTIGIYLMLGGTSQEQWEVYRQVVPDEPPLYGEELGFGLTLQEAAESALRPLIPKYIQKLKEPFTHDQ